MIRTTSILAAYAASPREILRENLATRQTLSITAFYLPEGQKLTFQPTPGIDRLHLLLKGRCRLLLGASQLMVEEGHALGIGAPGAHQLEAEQAGMAFLTVAIKAADGVQHTVDGGLTILDLLGPGRQSAQNRLHEWAQGAVVAGRVAFLPLELSPPLPTQILPSSERLLLVLEGSLSLETPSGVQTVGSPTLYELPPDTPHRLRSGAHGRTTVLAISDPEPAEATITHLSCGHRARFCDLVRYAGDGMIQIDAIGQVLDLNGPAARALGLPDTSYRGALSTRLLPRDGEWLSQKLRLQEHLEPAHTIWASPAVDNLTHSVLFLPYQGLRRLNSALIYLRPMLSAYEKKDPSPVTAVSLPEPESEAFVAQSPRMADLIRNFPQLAADGSWAVVWGERGTGRNAVAALLHRLGPDPQQPFRILNCSRHDPQTIPTLLFGSPKPRERLAEPGSWLQGLGTGTLLIEDAHTLPVGVQNTLLRALSELKTTGRLSGRVIVELDHRPQKGLPVLSPGSKLPRRGGFVIIELPPLRERAEDIPLLLRLFMARAASGRQLPSLTSDALEALMSHTYPGNLHDLERIGRALVASPLEGPVTAPVLSALLGRRKHDTVFSEDDEVPPLATVERELLLKALRRSGGNKADAARRLGVTRTRLYRMLIEHQIDV